MLTAPEKRFRFADCLGHLLLFATKAGIFVQVGEVYRSPEQAALNAKAGTGVANSLHTQRLAVDLLVFRKHNFDYDYVTDGTAPEYAQLGAFWKSLDDLCRWGGDFHKADPNHFSLTHGGVS